MRKTIISLFISFLIVAIKIVNFPVGENYTLLWEVISCSLIGVVSFIACMIVLPHFKNYDDEI